MRSRSWPHENLGLAPPWPHTNTMDDLQKFNTRFPAILYKRIQAEVQDRQKTEAKFSINDWVLEASREKLDGGVLQPQPSVTIYKERALGPTAGGNGGARKPTPAELAAAYGVKLGKNIEEVEPRLDPDSGFKAPPPLPPKRICSVDDDEEGYYENKCHEEFGAKYIFQAMKQLGKRWNQMTWKQRYEWFCEKREQEMGS